MTLTLLPANQKYNAQPAINYVGIGNVLFGDYFLKALFSSNMSLKGFESRVKRHVTVRMFTACYFPVFIGG
jgi:hypothetical protein